VAAEQGRGLDDLPDQQRIRAAECLACSLEPVELKRAFRNTTETLLEELGYIDSGLASKLKGPLQRIAQCLAFE
jgi:hypothetical protein